jgi:hypothetical protein
MSTYEAAAVNTTSVTTNRTPIWRVGAVAAVAAAIATELFVVVAKALDIPMETAGWTTEPAQEIPAGGFAMMTVLWTAVGTVLAVVLARRAKQPARTFVVTTVVLTVLSLVSPLTANDTTTATIVVLCLSHVVAAAVVIPALARRLHQEDTVTA